MTTLYCDPERIWARVQRRIEVSPEGCWLYTGAINGDGYGNVYAGREGRTVTVHRLAVIIRDGSIPNGMTVDHQCHDSAVCDDASACLHRRCFNPDHLVVMTDAENNGRRWRGDHCLRGHPFEVRTGSRAGQRQCPTCKRLRERERRARLKAAAA